MSWCWRNIRRQSRKGSRLRGRMFRSIPPETKQLLLRSTQSMMIQAVALTWWGLFMILPRSKKSSRNCAPQMNASGNWRITFRRYSGLQIPKSKKTSTSARLMKRSGGGLLKCNCNTRRPSLKVWFPKIELQWWWTLINRNAGKRLRWNIAFHARTVPFAGYGIVPSQFWMRRARWFVSPGSLQTSLNGKIRRWNVRHCLRSRKALPLPKTFMNCWDWSTALLPGWSLQTISSSSSIIRKQTCSRRSILWTSMTPLPFHSNWRRVSVPTSSVPESLCSWQTRASMSWSHKEKWNWWELTHRPGSACRWRSQAGLSAWWWCRIMIVLIAIRNRTEIFSFPSPARSRWLSSAGKPKRHWKIVRCAFVLWSRTGLIIFHSWQWMVPCYGRARPPSAR